MKKHMDAIDVRVGVEVIDARRVERAGPPNDPVHFVAFFEQQIGEITSVLSRYACDKCALHFVATINDASTARWAAINSPIPFRPEISIASSSSLENVASSPEPCIST